MHSGMWVQSTLSDWGVVGQWDSDLGRSIVSNGMRVLAALAANQAEECSVVLMMMALYPILPERAEFYRNPRTCPLWILSCVCAFHLAFTEGNWILYR